MWRSVLAFCGLLLSQFNLNAEPQIGDVIFRESFDQPNALGEWKVTGQARLELGYHNTLSLHLNAPDRTRGVSVRKALPVDQLRNKRIRVSARVKADNVAQPPKPWNGIKVMIHTVSPDGPQWTNPENLHGNFDWKTATTIVAIPGNITEAWLMLGIEETSGSAWIDDVEIKIDAVCRTRPTKPAVSEGQPFQPWRGTELTRMRGVMYGPHGTANDLRDLAKWNVNLIRWQLHWVDRGRHDGWRDLPAYNAWLESVLRELDALLPLCEQLGIKVLIDLHSPPGGGIHVGTWPLFQEKRYQDRFLEIWEMMARRYRDQKAVWGYDLANEPIEKIVNSDCMNWHSLATEAARRIRAIDPDHAIVVEPGEGGHWSNLPFFPPLPVKGVVYSVHMYKPHEFTHQSLDGSLPTIRYPGIIKGRKWDREELRKELKEVRQYQLDYGVAIFIGEFSAIRWAPDNSAYRYLSDLISIFEEWEWDWTYHAFREWQGWSVEFDSDRMSKKPSAAETDRAKLLKSHFARNPRTTGS